MRLHPILYSRSSRFVSRDRANLKHTARALVLAAFATATLSCSGDKSIGPPEPSSGSAVETNAPSATAGLVMVTPLGFVVKDAAGSILGGVSVTIRVTAGGGSITNTPTTTVAGGPTPIGTWTLGRTAGVNTVTITVPGIAPITISVNGIAGPPASVAVVSGGAQSALAGTDIGTVTVQVRDQFGNGVPSTTVTFTVTAGDGSIPSQRVTTDGAGNATAPAWKLGKTAAPQTLFASAAGFSVSISATVRTDYGLDLRFFGPAMPAAAADAFTRAAARIRGGIIGDVINVQAPNPGVDLESNCGVTGVTAFSESIDDVIIYASVSPIDGAGKILASAGPCFVRDTANGSATIIGVMRFDADDIEALITSGRMNDVILHEMLHVVGVGTLWVRKNLLVGGGTSTTRFVGPLAIAACHSLGGLAVCDASVPVENTGGGGTADSHWRESIFNDELMTGFIEPPGALNFLSSITVQSLADLGYVVNNFATDAYSIPGQSAMARTSASILSDVGAAPGWESVKQPVMEMSRSGRVRKVTAQ